MSAPSSRPDRLVRGLWLLAAAGAGLALLAFTALALVRLVHPYELEWIEGSSVDLVARVVEGQPLYTKPSIRFVPYLYTPLYFYLSGALAHLVGVGYIAPRAVSIVATFACFALLYAIARRETGVRLAGLVAVGLYAASYRLCGAWFDTARSDSLFLALVLGGYYAVRYGRGLGSAGLAGALFGLGVLTKQTAAVVALPVVLAAFVRPPRGLSAAGAMGLIAGGGSLLLDHLHDGWFLVFVYELPSSHQILREHVGGFWTQDVLRNLPIAFVLATAVALRALLRRSAGRLDPYPLALLLGAVGGSWYSRMHAGGYDNALMPACAVLALWTATAAGQARSNIGASAALSVAVLIQLGLLAYDPRMQIPTRADREAGDALVRRIAKVDGDVLIPSHGFLARQAGKPAYMHLMAYLDVVRTRRADLVEPLQEDVRTALLQRRFGALVLDSPYLLERLDVLPTYAATEDAFESAHVFWPVTGRRTRPESIYTPRR